MKNWDNFILIQPKQEALRCAKLGKEGQHFLGGAGRTLREDGNIAEGTLIGQRKKKLAGRQGADTQDILFAKASIFNTLPRHAQGSTRTRHRHHLHSVCPVLFLLTAMLSLSKGFLFFCSVGPEEDRRSSGKMREVLPSSAFSMFGSPGAYPKAEA